MSPFAASFWGNLAAMVALCVVLALGLIGALPALCRAALHRFTRRPLHRLLSEEYTTNWGSFWPLMWRFTPRVMSETMLRALRGKALQRPMGSPLRLSPWESLLFSPTYLTRLPIGHGEEIETAVTIGPAARRPLQLKIPILITGMSFGSALSEKVKVALAMGASRAGTATNSGEAFLQSERDAADLLIVQLTRGTWPTATQYNLDLFQHADAIEIQLGQGAQAAVPQITPAAQIDKVMRETHGLQEGEDSLIDARLERVRDAGDLRDLVQELQQRFGVPVGYKFGATHHQEAELEAAVAAGVDFIVVDGAEGGTHGASTTTEDDVGLPTLWALARTLRYLEQRGVRDRISVIAGGGLRTPGEYMKAMALGADAVYIGNAALIALIADQWSDFLPDEPPTSLLLYAGKKRDRFDVDRGARNLYRYLTSCVTEMKEVAAAVGKRSLAEVDRSDLVTVDEHLARLLDIPLAWEPEAPAPLQVAHPSPAAAREATPTGATPTGADGIHTRAAIDFQGFPLHQKGGGPELEVEFSADQPKGGYER